MTIHIETERLRLRDFTNEDLDDCWRLSSIEEVMRYTAQSIPSRSEMQQIIEKEIMGDYEKHGFGFWIMELKSTGEFMGYCGLKRWQKDNDEVVIGYRMFKKFWGKGYASEATIPCVEYGFNKLGLNRIAGYAHPDNLGSVKVLRKLHMEQCTTLTIKGVEYLGFELSREKWLTSKN